MLAPHQTTAESGLASRPWNKIILEWIELHPGDSLVFTMPVQPNVKVSVVPEVFKDNLILFRINFHIVENLFGFLMAVKVEKKISLKNLSPFI
jgi:hypothetical protein